MMIKRHKTRAATEFGDFQTPPTLALATTEALVRIGIRPRSILEPTCGRGAFVRAAMACFPDAEAIIGFDINRNHLRAAEASTSQADGRVELRAGDFFNIDWGSIVSNTQGPWLILGNPPWVTSAELGAIESDNLPVKSNFHRRAGIDAITGKSNFDISEWMLMRYLDWLEGSNGTIAVLCKTAVARKILLYVWKKRSALHSARIYKVDALSHFGAAVDACFFILETQPMSHTTSCGVFDNLRAETPARTIGFLDGHIVSDVTTFNRYRNLLGPEERYVWRSGIKHDCSKVMELTLHRGACQNGLGEIVTLEDTLLFPMLKSSDIGNGRTQRSRVMIVTQRRVGEDTSCIKSKAPLTWEYLTSHANNFDKRGSVIYKNKPPFSIFGVGPYTFAPWKLAISGFYKKLHFVKIGPINDRPVVFDDTIYFLPCWSEEEADYLESLLYSEPAQVFFHAMIDWNDKRPITADVLKSLSICKLATLLEQDQEYFRYTAIKDAPLFKTNDQSKSEYSQLDLYPVRPTLP